MREVLFDLPAEAFAKKSWAYAALGLREHRPVLNSMSFATCPTAGESNPIGLSSTAWSCSSRLMEDQGRMMRLALARGIVRERQYMPRNITMTAWAFSMLFDDDEPLFAAIVGCVMRRALCATDTPQDFATTAWAFSTLTIQYLQLLDAVFHSNYLWVGDFP